MSAGSYTVNSKSGENQEIQGETTPDGIYVIPTQKERVKKKDSDKPAGLFDMNGMFGQSHDVDDDFEEDDDWEENDYADIQGDHKNIIGIVVKLLQNIVIKFVELLQRCTKNNLVTVALLLGYAAYFIAAMIYKFGDEGSHRLVGCTVLGVVIFTRRIWLKAIKSLYKRVVGEGEPNPRALKRIGWISFVIRWCYYLAMLGIVVWVLVDEGREDISHLRGLPGLVAFVILCLLFSSDPARINWTPVFLGLGLQFVLAVCTLKYSFGRDALLWVQSRLTDFFGNGATASLRLFGPNYKQFDLLFGSLPLAFFMSGTLSLLYYVGFMQLVINIFGVILSLLLNTHPIESFSIAAGIFLEGFIAVLSLRPFMAKQSRSQLFTILTSTYTSLGGAIIGILAGFGIPLNNIIPAMLISAPATVAVCKLMIPETRPKDHKLNKIDSVAEIDTGFANALDAYQTGAMMAVPLVGNIISMAFSLIAMMSWVSHTLTWFGDRIGFRNASLEFLFSYALYPVALAMGVEPSECRAAAKLLGYRLVASNFVAFIEMMTMKQNKHIFAQYMAMTNMTGPYSHDEDDIILHGMNHTRLRNGFISDRTEAIVTFSLCGMSGLFSLGLTTGAFLTIVPKRRAWLSKMAIPALIAGNIANCMTGCFASLFY